VNLIGSLRKETYMTASVIKTLRAAFDQVGVFPAFDRQNSETGIGNIILMAYQGSVRGLQAGRANFQTHASVQRMVSTNLGKQFVFPADTPAIVLTDDYNPIDFFDGWLRETVRGMILETTDWDILIS